MGEGRAAGVRASDAIRAAVLALAAAALAACAAPTHIEGHAIRAVAGYADDQSALADGLHQGAPAWFGDWWRAYLRHARGGHAVLALDRNGRGGWYVYCATAGCHRLTHPFTRSVRDVHYTRRALERCRARVGEADPAARPDCALYAIRNRIVWQGPLPWEEGRAPAPSAQGGAAVGASADMIGVHVARDMLEFWRWGGMIP